MIFRTTLPVVNKNNFQRGGTLSTEIWNVHKFLFFLTPTLRWFWGTFISLHTRSVWETICDTLPHSSCQNFLVQNSLSVPTRVFQECWSGPPTNSPSKVKFGQILALGIWVGLDWWNANSQSSLNTYLIILLSAC